MVPATNAEAWIQMVELEQQRTEEEPRRGRSLMDKGTRCSRRIRVPMHRMVDARPRRSRRDEGAQRSQWTRRSPDRARRELALSPAHTP